MLFESLIPKPESTEEHAFGRFIIEMELYKLPDGRYKVWPFVKKVGLHGETKIHFVLKTVFPSKEVARAAALKLGQKRFSWLDLPFKNRALWPAERPTGYR
jgi:hypothetical protein